LNGATRNGAFLRNCFGATRSVEGNWNGASRSEQVEGRKSKRASRRAQVEGNLNGARSRMQLKLRKSKRASWREPKWCNWKSQRELKWRNRMVEVKGNWRERKSRKSCWRKLSEVAKVEGNLMAQVEGSLIAHRQRELKWRKSNLLKLRKSSERETAHVKLKRTDWPNGKCLLWHHPAAD
jgi:hypothetical protein